MWQVLEPLRRVRPVNGGTGLGIDLTMSLRSLDIIFPHPNEQQNVLTEVQ